MKNWWYYHKWYVIIGVILFLIICNLIGNALGLFRKSPDLQVAYIGKASLPADTAAAIQEAFTSLAADYNHDGEIIVQVNQYVNGNDNPDADTAYYQYASEITLIGDISDCESYFFLWKIPQIFSVPISCLLLQTEAVRIHRIMKQRARFCNGQTVLFSRIWNLAPTPTHRLGRQRPVITRIYFPDFILADAVSTPTLSRSMSKNVPDCGIRCVKVSKIIKTFLMGNYHFKPD